MITENQAVAAAHAMNNALERWRYHEADGDFMVVKFPERNVAAQTMECWHFDNKGSAKRFRDTQVVNAVVAKLLDLAAIAVVEP